MSLAETLNGRGKRRKAVKGNAFNRNLAETKRALYHCNYCQKDISNVVRIKCAVCADFDLCLECFSVGVEITPHKNSHAYRVVDNLSFPLYHPDWGADEELLLLEAVDMFGLGNWGGVADHVGTKSKQQCKEHYFQVYVEVDSFPLPAPVPEMVKLDLAKYIADLKAGRKTPLSLAADMEAAAAARAPSEEPSEPRSPSGRGEEDGAEPSAVDEPSSEGRKGSKRARTALREAAPKEEPQSESKPTHVQVGGRSMHSTASPGALERSTRALAGAPAAVAAAATPQAAANTTSGVAEVDVGAANGTAAGPATGAGNTEPGEKPKISNKKTGTLFDMTGYNVKRNEFDPEYDNDAEMVVAEMEFRDDETPEEASRKLRMLELYNRRLDERERRRAFVVERGLLDVRRLQALEKRRNPAEREMHAQLRVFARYQSQPEHEALVDGLVLEQRMRARIQELKEYRRNGIRTFADAEAYDQDKRRRLAQETAAGTGKMDRANRYVARSGLDEQAVAAQAAHAAALAMAGTPQELKKLGCGGVATVRSPANALLSWQKRRGVALDITGLPGVEALSARERELCSSVRLLPAHYLVLKDSLMRDCERNGTITKQEVRNFFRLEPAKTVRIYELLTSAGWITGAPSGPKLSADGAGGGGGTREPSPERPAPAARVSAAGQDGLADGFPGAAAPHESPTLTAMSE